MHLFEQKDYTQAGAGTGSLSAGSGGEEERQVCKGNAHERASLMQRRAGWLGVRQGEVERIKPMCQLRCQDVFGSRLCKVQRRTEFSNRFSNLIAALRTGAGDVPLP